MNNISNTIYSYYNSFIDYFYDNKQSINIVNNNNLDDFFINNDISDNVIDNKEDIDKTLNKLYDISHDITENDKTIYNHDLLGLNDISHNDLYNNDEISLLISNININNNDNFDHYCNDLFNSKLTIIKSVKDKIHNNIKDSHLDDDNKIKQIIDDIVNKYIEEHINKIIEEDIPFLNNDRFKEFIDNKVNIFVDDIINLIIDRLFNKK